MNDDELKLQQLGLTALIMCHDVNSTLFSLGKACKELKLWANANPNSSLPDLYKTINSCYAYINEYFNIVENVNPDYKRYSRIEIEGSTLRNFLQNLFKSRLEGINLEIDKSFNHGEKIYGYLSTFYPAFINCIENSIYWTKDVENPTITLSKEGRSFIISDNGPGIKEQSKIFKKGFSLREGGHGVGLHTAKLILNKDDWDLILDPYEEGKGATFRITELPKEEVDNEL